MGSNPPQNPCIESVIHIARVKSMNKVKKWTFRQRLPACLKLTFMSVLFVSWQHQVMFTVVTIRQADCLACLFDRST